ncbi:hypothetical protein Dimus_030346, partial [Dionaea muscipula]
MAQDPIDDFVDAVVDEVAQDAAAGTAAPADVVNEASIAAGEVVLKKAVEIPEAAAKDFEEEDTRTTDDVAEVVEEAG